MKKIFLLPLRVAFLVALFFSFSLSVKADGISDLLSKNSKVRKIKEDVTILRSVLWSNIKNMTQDQRGDFKNEISIANGNYVKSQEVYAKYFTNAESIFKITNSIFENIGKLNRNKKVQKMTDIEKNTFFNGLLLKRTNGKLPDCSSGLFYGGVGCANYAYSLSQQGYSQEIVQLTLSVCLLYIQVAYYWF